MCSTTSVTRVVPGRPILGRDSRRNHKGYGVAEDKLVSVISPVCHRKIGFVRPTFGLRGRGTLLEKNSN